MRELTEKLLAGQNLAPGEAGMAAEQFATGNFDSTQAADFLVAMESKGVTGQELTEFVLVFRAHAKAVSGAPPEVVDTCGTGGGIPSWNLSTAAAIIAAGAGACVAKHGNRAVTSRCGSADVLEALGIRLDADPARCWEAAGIAFLFAPAYHPAFAHVAPVRRQLGVRTIFNMLGPLLNPAHATRQLIGVRSAEYLAPIAQAATMLGTTHGVVVHGQDGLDEVSPCAATSVFRSQCGIVSEEVWDLLEIGAGALDATQILPGDSLEENATLVRMALADAESPQFAAVLPSAAAAIWVSGVASSWADGAARARESVQSGRAAHTLTTWVEASQLG